MKVFLNNLTIFGLLFFIMIESVFSTTVIENVLKPNTKMKFAKNTLFLYNLTLDNSSNEGKYVKLDVIGGNSITNYVVSVYTDKERNKRIQLGQSYNGNTKLYLSFEGKKINIIYIEIECSSTCSGTIENQFSNIITLNEGDLINYYVTDEFNKKMEFSLNVSSSISNVWARGQSNIKTELECQNKIQKANENFYIVKEILSGDVFTVTAESEDFINVGCIGFISDTNSETEYNYTSSSKITVNGPTITGYLKKDTINQVCYNLEMKDKPKNEREDEKVIFGTGNIITKNGNSFLLYNNKRMSDDDVKEQLFPFGILCDIISSSELEQTKVCISFWDSKKYSQFSEITEIVFNYQLIEDSLINNGLNLYEPQLNGVFYPRFSTQKTKAAYIGHYNDFKKMNLNLMTLNGFPKMHVIECDNYPLCSLDNLENGIRPRNINRFSSYSYTKKENIEYSLLSKSQTLFVVECEQNKEKAGEQESKYFDALCGYGTIIYKDGAEIELIENHYFNQFSLKDEEHKYKIKIAGESNIKKIFIDIMTYIGDVEITINSPKDLNYGSYVSINKIYLSLKVDEYKEKIDNIIFTVKGTSNTYYTALVNFIRDEKVEEDSQITNKLETGMPYLVTIDTTKKNKNKNANKIVKIMNEKHYDFIPMMVNFYSLNCKINVTQSYNDNGILKEENAKVFDHLSQDVIDPNNKRYDNEQLEYRINVIENDTSQYEGELCKLFASAIELSDKHEDNSRDILIPDNIPQQIMFGKNINHVSYGYVHVDFENDLLIKFNLKHKAKYIVKLYYENVQKGEEEIITANDIIIIKKADWEDRCKDKTRVCYIQIDISLNKINIEENPVLEFSVKSMASNFVSYIIKNMFKIDYVQNNNPQYYYTEIGEKENGFIIANFLRGSGKVYAKVVEKQIKSKEDNADWRGKYKLPTENEELKMDPFTKKLNFFTNKKNCQNGCYLLIKILSDVEGGNIPIDRNYPYSLIVHTYPIHEINQNLPVMNIPLDEYIIGNIDNLEKNQNIYEFYTVWLNSDANKVIIDFQSGAGELFINVGNNKPKFDNNHFKFGPSGKDTIYTLKKEDILKYANNKSSSLKDIILTIGIWVNNTDSIYTTPYAFIIRLEDDTLNNIYKINSDQKALCNPKKVGNIFRCLYVIEYDYISTYNDLFVYATANDESASLNIYANYIDAELYDMGDISLQNLIPTKKNTKFPNEDQNVDYLYIKEGLNKTSYLFISIEVKKETIIELMSSFFLYQNGITPKPSSPQLFIVKNNLNLTLNFPKEYKEMINLICIGGKAEIYWVSDENNKYYLKGRDDRLSITSLNPNKEHKLIISSKEHIENGNGFIFYLNYNKRINNFNIDALDLNKSIYYVYLDNDLPISYYAPLFKSNMKSDDFYEIFFTFNNLQNDIKKELTFYENIPFDVNAFIVKESDVYDLRILPDMKVSSNVIIKGVYDQAIRTGIIRISETDIDNSNISKIERPYLYLKIDKTEEFKNIRKYNKLGIETTALKSSSGVSISELSNQFGCLTKYENERKYVLRINQSFKYMNLQFSCLEDNLSVLIEGREKDLKLEETKYGKSFYSLKIQEKENKTTNLIVRRNNNSKLLNDEYFMLQYTYSNDKVNNQYSISNTTLKVIKRENSGLADYLIELTPVNNSSDYDITYIIRLIFDGEMPKIPDLSMKFNKQNVKEYYNPTEKNNKLNLNITNINKNVKYVQVIAQIRNNEVVEYMSYNLTDQFQIEKISQNKDNQDNMILIIIISVVAFLFIFVIILVTFACIYNRKAKDLIDKVNSISFIDNNKNKDNLLLGPEKNVLV